jgi:hypothetical protein
MIRAWPVALMAILGCGLQRGSIPDAGPTATAKTAESTLAEADAARVPVVPVPPLLSAEPVHKKVASRCAGGEVSILLQPGEETCVIECKSAASCPAGWACDGEGSISNAGRPGPSGRFCRIASRPKVGDAGALPPAPAAPKDAGPPAPVKKLDVKLVGGQCPAWYRACGAGCRLTCTKDTDCEFATAHCQGGYCLGPGAMPCAK